MGKYVLTLLAQRRELRLNDIQELFSTEGEEVPAPLAQKLAFEAASSAILESERQGLQAELTLPMDSGYGGGSNAADIMMDDITRSQAPLAGTF